MDNGNNNNKRKLIKTVLLEKAINWILSYFIFILRCYETNLINLYLSRVTAAT